MKWSDKRHLYTLIDTMYEECKKGFNYELDLDGFLVVLNEFNFYSEKFINDPQYTYTMDCFNEVLFTVCEPNCNLVTLRFDINSLLTAVRSLNID